MRTFSSTRVYSSSRILTPDVGTPQPVTTMVLVNVVVVPAAVVRRRAVAAPRRNREYMIK